MKYLHTHKQFLILENTNITDILDDIITDCAPYIKFIHDNEIAEPLLFKGIKNRNLTRPSLMEIEDGVYIEENAKKSKPRDTNIEVRDLFDDLFQREHGIRLREQGIFTTRSEDIALEYGEKYIIIPIGIFSYYWSPDIYDFYNHIKPYTWYEELFDDGNNYDDFYGDPRFNGGTSDINGYFISTKTGDKISLKDIKDDDNVKWIPYLSQEEYLDDLRMDMQYDIEEAVDSYIDYDFDEINDQEIILICDEYYIIHHDYLDIIYSIFEN